MLLVGLMLAILPVRAQPPAAAAAPKKEAAPLEQKPAAEAPAAEKKDAPQDAFFLHAFHAKQLSLDCGGCHLPVKEGSVELKRPGHDQCMTCHAEAFGDKLNPKICQQCHLPESTDLLPFPRFKKSRAILFEFSHAKHVDPKGRLDARTGFRADCAFCHKFNQDGVFATFPGHTQCTACHAAPGMKPNLSAKSTTADCRGCHTPEEIENPGFTEDRRMISAHVVSGKYVNLKFSHIAHFKEREHYNLNCTTCHYAIPQSNSLASLTLPKMIDCVACHDSDKTISADFRMSNCKTCHIDQETGTVPASHTRFVKPAFHNESFRPHHDQEASAPGAKCFVCHTNVVASATAKGQCWNCHQVMRPANHMARWKDEVHGKIAAIDRESCATCHTSDNCVRCHNILPSSHAPLALFKGGGHARLAMLDERSCLTCHTFQNTCAECHTRGPH